jgi:hypothetical protein
VGALLNYIEKQPNFDGNLEYWPKINLDASRLKIGKLLHK